ncbi:MAG: hypothetical protein IJH39_09025 [Clostridia bacterium]|nr:hypothetical protein [Clostridia bacterium]
MSEFEDKARELKRCGNNCSVSLYTAFKEKLGLRGVAPQPRSSEGQCGALLTAKKILEETGYADKIDALESEFVKRFGYSKCVDLMSYDRRCVDYVGECAKMIEEILKGM